MAIDRETWTIIGPLFDRLMDRPSAERASELASADLAPTHRAILESLLQVHDADDDLLARSASDLLGLQDHEPAAMDWSGRMLGPWRVDRPLAQGGMSVVYVGARADGRFDMQVAIKVLKTDRIRIPPERLEAETRILARLQHPGIARLIDSGAGEDGQPYLVMEFIDGTPIDRFCAERVPDPRERVRQVLAIAEALDYAHQRQVVHCDIKPANVLIRPDGRPCIVDFGISALIQRDDEVEEQPNRFCSPGFAAPECYRKAPPDTAQDVYSLGAVLSELLVAGGVHALTETDGRGRPSSTDEAPRPMPAHDGSGRLPDDLMALLRHALAARPEDRYRSMAALAADLRAWLEHRPVEAWGGGRAYAIAKWLRRHRVAASLGALAALSLVAGTGVALHQADLAREEAARALAVRDFTVGLFNAADPTLEDGRDPPASELLRRGAARISSELDTQPAQKTEMLQIIGAVQLQRGLIDEATATLDLALAAAELHATDQALFARTLSERGMAAYEQGDLDGSIDFLRRAGQHAGQSKLSTNERARIATRLADMYLVRGEPEPALALVAPLLEQIHEAGARAYALRVYGGALEQLGRLDDAATQLELSLEAQRADDPDNVFLATILNELGIVRWRQGRLDDAAAIYQRSLAHKRRIYGDVHPQTLASLGNLAAVQAERGDFPAAEQAWVDSLEALALLHGDQPHPDTAYTHAMLSWTIYRSGKFEEANGHARQGLQIIKALPESPSHLTWISALTGLTALEVGDPDAEDLLGPWNDDCATLDDKRQLGAQVCLARAWLAAAGGECARGLPPTTSARSRNDLPERWRAVHAAVVDACAGRAPSAADALPRWVRADTSNP